MSLARFIPVFIKGFHRYGFVLIGDELIRAGAVVGIHQNCFVLDVISGHDRGEAKQVGQRSERRFVHRSETNSVFIYDLAFELRSPPGAGNTGRIGEAFDCQFDIFSVQGRAVMELYAFAEFQFESIAVIQIMPFGSQPGYDIPIRIVIVDFHQAVKEDPFIVDVRKNGMTGRIPAAGEGAAGKDGEGIFLCRYGSYDRKQKSKNQQQIEILLHLYSFSIICFNFSLFHLKRFSTTLIIVFTP